MSNCAEKSSKICTNCVMDNSDSQIDFDVLGVCDHCNLFYENIEPNWNTGDRGRRELQKILANVRKSGKGKDFDCILGLSGGLDSSYMLHVLVNEFGLRPLVFHVDGGWNSELAVNNIQVLIEKMGLDLYTEVIDWEDMQDFQLAFFKSGVSQLDIPQDHAFVATLYKFAQKYNVKFIMNGGNIATECVRNPLEWLYYGTDMWFINDIRRQFCSRSLENYPFSSVLYHKVYLRYILGVEVVQPLNYFSFSKQKAIDTLSREYGWQGYPRKHFESRFTKFFESYWLPTRFGYDTRKVQYSSLILTNQMSRIDALEQLALPPYDLDTIDDEFEYVARKLGVSLDELRSYHEMPLKSYKDYKNQEVLFNIGAKILRSVGIERSIKR